MGPVVEPEEVRRRFAKVIEAMRAAGVWDIERPADSAFENMGAFGMKTMAFAQWLRWVFVPRVEEALTQNGPWPSGSAVSLQATREGDTDPVVASLVESLSDFDELFEEPSEVAGRALSLAEGLLAEGRYDDALSANLRAIEICPSRTNVYNHAGYILSHKPDRTPADLERAVEYFREAHSRASVEVPPVANLADALVALGRTNEAIWELERISKQGTGAAADNWLGWHFSRQEIDLERAERHLREAVKRAPDMGIARLNLAWVLDRKGDEDGAYAEYVKTLEASGNRDLAFTHARKGAIEERKGWLRNALAFHAAGP